MAQDPISLMAEDESASEDTASRFEAMTEGLAEHWANRAATPEVGGDGTGVAVAPEPDLEDESAESAEPVVIEPVEPVEPTPDTTIRFGDDLAVERAELEQLARWAHTLTDADRARIDLALAAPAPASAPAPAPAPPPALGQPGMPIAPVTPDLAVLAEVAPDLAPYLAQLQTTLTAQADQLAQYQATTAQTQAYQANQERDRQMGLIRAGQTAFMEAHPTLSAEQVDSLARRAAELQVMPALVKQHDGAIDKAYVAAMDTAMWSDPDYRAELIQSATVAAAESSAALTARKGKAGALTGAAGSVSRSATTPVPKNRVERQAAMAREIAASRVDS